MALPFDTDALGDLVVAKLRFCADDGKWIPTHPYGNDGFSNLAFRTAGTRVRFGFPAQLHARQQPRHPRRVMQDDRLDRLIGGQERESVVVNSLNEPALLFVVPEVIDGLNGRLAPGHGPAFGPLVISKCDWETDRQGMRSLRDVPTTA